MCFQVNKTGNTATYVTTSAVATANPTPPATHSWIGADDDIEMISPSSVNYAVGPLLPLVWYALPDVLDCFRVPTSLRLSIARSVPLPLQQ